MSINMNHCQSSIWTVSLSLTFQTSSWLCSNSELIFSTNSFANITFLYSLRDPDHIGKSPISCLMRKSLSWTLSFLSVAVIFPEQEPVKTHQKCIQQERMFTSNKDRILCEGFLGNDERIMMSTLCFRIGCSGRIHIPITTPSENGGGGVNVSRKSVHSIESAGKDGLVFV